MVSWRLKQVPSQCRIHVFTTLKLLVVFSFLCLAFRSQQKYSDHLLKSLEGHLPYDDDELISYIQNEVLVPPSTAPYNLINNGRRPANLINSELFNDYFIKKLFGDMNGGFFIEAGALDGETMSVSLPLELKQNWSGLLVECDLINYRSLVTKNRKTWIANTCLAPNSYPSKEIIAVAGYHPSSTIVSDAYKFKARAMNGLAKYSLKVVTDNSYYKSVQCLPLSSILVAMGRYHVDLFILDVEGAEMDILLSTDLKKFLIDVIFMESRDFEDHPKVVRSLDSLGYKLHKSFKEDLIFVRKGTKYDRGPAFDLSSTPDKFNITVSSPYDKSRELDNKFLNSLREVDENNKNTGKNLVRF